MAKKSVSVLKRGPAFGRHLLIGTWIRVTDPKTRKRTTISSKAATIPYSADANVQLRELISLLKNKPEILPTLLYHGQRLGHGAAGQAAAKTGAEKPKWQK